MGLFDDILKGSPATTGLFDDMLGGAPVMPVDPVAPSLGAVVGRAIPNSPTSVPSLYDAVSPIGMTDNLGGALNPNRPRPLLTDLPAESNFPVPMPRSQAPVDQSNIAGLADMVKGWLQQAPVDMSGIDPNPPGTAAGRAVKRGAVRTAASLPYMLATADNTAIQEAKKTDQKIGSDLFLEMTGLPNIPDGVDISTPEKASAALSDLGYPSNYPNVFRQLYETKIQRAADARANPKKFQDRFSKNAIFGQNLIDKANSIPMSPAGERTKRRFSAGKSAGETFATILNNPLDSLSFLGEVGVESAPQIAATVAASVVTKSPVVSAAVLGSGSFVQEYGSAVSDFLQNQKVKLKTREDAIRLLNDPETMKKASDRGVTRGVVIAAFEMLGQGAATKSFMKTHAGNALVDLATQMGTGAGGEAAAQAASGQKTNWQEIIIEGLAEGVTAPVEVGAAIYASKKGGTADKGQVPPSATPAPPPAPEAAVAPHDAPQRPAKPFAPVASPKAETSVQTPQNPSPKAESPVVVPASETPVQTQDAPAPIKTPTKAPEKTTVYTSDNKPVKVETIVVEASDLLTSDQKGYPANLQPRDRNRAASQAQIEGIANKPIGARLNASPETDRGAPIIANTGATVESGNGRIMGLRRAYERGTAAEYRAYVEQNFPEAKGMTNPIIVRRRITDVNQQQFANVSNVSATLQMSATENAKADAALIDQNVISQYKGGGLANTGNRGMIRAFIAKLPQSVQGAMTTEQGGLSIEGQKRFQNALFYKAYGDDRLLNRLAESTDDQMRSVTNALADSAGRVAQMRGAIDRGEVSPKVDVVSDMMDAIARIAEFRAKEMDLKGYRAQVDAFAKPASEATDAFMSAFYNEAETRMVSKQAMQDFVENYVNAAMEQKVDQGQLAGVEAKPLKTGTEIVNETHKAKKAEATTQTLLDAAGPDRKRTGKRGGKEQRAVDGENRTGTSEKTLKDEAPKVETKTTGKTQPKGSLAPTFLDFSFTNRNSVFEAAFRAAGLDPNQAKLLNVDDQIKTLRAVLYQRYGVRVEFPKRRINRKTITGRKVQEERRRISTRDAIDQMLDAYRQMEMLAHIFGVPHQAIGLKNKEGQTIALSLSNKLPGALGMFSRNEETGARTIHLPGRSNSFSHEWGHALDHWLGTYLFDGPTKDLLSREVLKDGLTPGATRSEGVAEAFVGLIQSLFGDKAKLAAMQLDLQQQSTDTFKSGKPSHKAKRALKLLADIAKGKAMPKEVWSKYFKTSKEYDAIFGKSYFQDPAEMLARAMEAFAGVKASEVSDLPTSFLSKPSWAYTGSEDQRAAMTFPRNADAMQIFAAFERLGDALRKAEIFGTKGKALKPEDVDVFDLRKWDNWQPRGSLLQQEKAAWAKKKGEVAKEQHGASSARKLMDVAGYFTSTFRGYLRGIVSRQPKKAQTVLTRLLDDYMTDPGSGRVIKDPWEDAVEAKAKHNTNRLDAIIRAFKLDKLNAEQMKEMRQLLTVPDSTTNDPHLQKAAAELRRLLDDVWRYMDTAGVKVGYVKNGWLPRIMNIDAVQANKQKFLDQAQKVYKVMFKNDVRNADIEDQITDVRRLVSRLGKANRPDDTGGTFRVSLFNSEQTTTIQTWRKALNAQSKAQKALDAANKAGDGDKVSAAEAALSEASDTFMEVHGEVLDIVEQIFAQESSRAWAARIELGGSMDFDTKGPDTQFLKKRTMPAETDKLMIDFFAGDALSLIQQYLTMAPRRAEYVRRAGVQGEKIENMLARAEQLGANGRDLREIRKSINMLTGRDRSSNHAATSWAGGWVYVAATVTLLKRSFWSSWAEPLVAGMRTGNTGDSLRSVVSFIGQMAHSKNAKDRTDIARIIGLITSAQHETIMMNRFGGDLDPNQKQGKVLANFFRYNLLTGLTNLQRSSMLAVSNAAINRHLIKALDGNKWSIQELADLGIDKEHFPALKEWIDSLGGTPTAGDLIGVDGGFYNDAAELYAVASNRLIQQIIQNPKRYHRPAAAIDSKFRAIYGITGFIYAFHGEILLPLLKRHIDARGANESVAKYAGRVTYGSARNIAQVAPAIAALFTGHFLVTILREAIFNADKWKEKDDENKLIEWLLWRTFSRTGLTGAFDIPYNLFTGVKYERDLAGAYAGPHKAWLLSDLQDILGLFSSRNSPNTNTAERKATEAALRMVFSTGNNMAISLLPGGPFSTVGYAAEMTAADAINPAAKMAEQLFPKKK